MSHEFYEVWAVGTDASEELVDTANSKLKAMDIANRSLIERKYTELIVYKETEDGELVEVVRLQS